MIASLKRRVKSALYYLPARLAAQTAEPVTRPLEYRLWLNAELAPLVERFVEENDLARSPFIMRMNAVFGSTRRFEVFLKKWLTEYLFSLFGSFETRARLPGEPLVLRDCVLHRWAADRFAERFGAAPRIEWEPRVSTLRRLARVAGLMGVVASLALRGGVRLWGRRRRFAVLREAIWGLEGRGRWFHDDFIVDGRTLKASDVLFFSRPQAASCADRAAAREHVLRSRYAHLDLDRQRVSLGVLLRRILPKYVLGGAWSLLGVIDAREFALFSSLFASFAAGALPYEALFSNFEVGAELGHNFFSASHIAEAIVCESRGTRYYLLHWSDNSVAANRYLTAFLGCDGYLVWGRAHLRGREVAPEKVVPIGYFFKHAIVGADLAERAAFLRAVGIPKGRRVVSFFDETFGGLVRMTEEHFLAFWGAAVALARAEPDIQVLIKPKGEFFHASFTPEGRRRFEALRREAEALPSVTILDFRKWAFIRAIACAELVVTQGMTSSSTIALISGVDALYLDQAGYQHPLKSGFMDRVVFDDPEKLVARIRAILAGQAERPLALIPPELLRELDAFDDDRGIERLRSVLLTGAAA